MVLTKFKNLILEIRACEIPGLEKISGLLPISRKISGALPISQKSSGPLPICRNSTLFCAELASVCDF